MLLKKSKLFVLCFVIFGFFFLVLNITAINLYAIDSINPQTDINCSKYLNIMHNDHFMNKIVVSTLKINPEYAFLE